MKNIKEEVPGNSISAQTIPTDHPPVGSMALLRRKKQLKSFKQYIKENEEMHGHINHFVGYACGELGLAEPPQISLIADKLLAAENSSFGGYHPGEKTIHVNTANRHLADILRTLAHELVHHKQNMDGRLTPDAGQTGSEFENEANSRAGVLMRNYGKNINPKIYEEQQ